MITHRLSSGRLYRMIIVTLISLTAHSIGCNEHVSYYPRIKPACYKYTSVAWEPDQSHVIVDLPRIEGGINLTTRVAVFKPMVKAKLYRNVMGVIEVDK